MKRIFSLFIFLLPLAVLAQTQFGFLSYETVMKEMPEYAQAQKELSSLRSKYEAEATRGETEFQKKFVEFLQGQKDFPQSIMQKRQAELQGLMDNGVEFRKKAQTLIAQAEADLLAGVQKRLTRAILEVGVEHGFGYILNTDGNSCPYINPVVGVDVTELVRQKLGLATAPAATQDADPAPAQQPATEGNASN